MKTVVLTLGLLVAIVPAWGQADDEYPAWVAKPDKPKGYVGINKPIIRLTELLERHKGQANWEEQVIDDEHLMLSYISMAPGGKTLRRFRPQTHEWWVVRRGQIRFDIEGQKPFVASEGWIVQVPKMTIYSMETVGNVPSLRLEVNIAKAEISYPLDVQPPPLPGATWMKLTTNKTPGPYVRGNKPFIVFDEYAAQWEKDQAAGKKHPVGYPSGVVVEDDRGIGTLIYGHDYSNAKNPPGYRGHWHPENSEIWTIMTGQLKFKLEGQKEEIIGSTGDIVYAPKNMWHLATYYGKEASCRFAMTGYPHVSHFLDK